MSDQSARRQVKHWNAKLIRTNVISSLLLLLVATGIDLVKFCEMFVLRVYRLLERRSDAGQGYLFRIAMSIAAVQN